MALLALCTLSSGRAEAAGAIHYSGTLTPRSFTKDGASVLGCDSTVSGNWCAGSLTGETFSWPGEINSPTAFWNHIVLFTSGANAGRLRIKTTHTPDIFSVTFPAAVRNATFIFGGRQFRFADASGSNATEVWWDSTGLEWTAGQAVSVQICTGDCSQALPGAVGATLELRNGDSVYASELFGEGHASPEWPEGEVPIVVLGLHAEFNSGEADVRFELSGGAEFAANVTKLLWDPVSGRTGDEGLRPASGGVVSIKEGGRKGNRFITLTITEIVGDRALPHNTNTVRSDRAHSLIAFELPRLQNLGALAGANALDADKANDVVSVTISAEATVRSGKFAQGPLVRQPPAVISARDSLTLKIMGHPERTVAIDDDAKKGLTAFRSLKEQDKDGRVELATVMIATKQVEQEAVAATEQELKYYIDNTPDADDGTPGNPFERNQAIYAPATEGKKLKHYKLYDLDGEEIDEGLRGAFSVRAMGTRELFHDGDALFVDYDGDGRMGGGEGFAVDGDTARSDSLSIDADKSDSFRDGVNGAFKVYYVPAGKGRFRHGAAINLTASVDYSDPSALDEADAKSSTALKYDGVGSPIRAYAIPHAGNEDDDRANVRVRCEATTGDCRVFLECWDDTGARGFGEAAPIPGYSLAKWKSADIERVTDFDPKSRISCRILSRGKVTVQQLTRDGNSGTLINNTYIGGG